MFMRNLLATVCQTKFSSWGLLEWFILAVALLITYRLIKRYYARKCPFCKKGFALKDIDEEFLGTVKTKREKQKDGSYQRCIIIK